MTIPKDILADYLKKPVTPKMLVDAVQQMHRTWTVKYPDDEGDVRISEEGDFIRIMWTMPETAKRPVYI